MRSPSPIQGRIAWPTNMSKDSAAPTEDARMAACSIASTQARSASVKVWLYPLMVDDGGGAGAVLGLELGNIPRRPAPRLQTREGAAEIALAALATIRPRLRLRAGAAELARGTVDESVGAAASAATSEG